MTAAPQHGTLQLDELLHVVRAAIADHPRSQQTRIGPSELGNPCDRWISHKLAGTPEINTRSAAWLPTVGTAIHGWLEDVFIRQGFAAVRDGVAPRWLVETTLTVGTIGGVDITGHCDLYDTETATIIDWKTTGKTRLDKYRRHGPDDGYRVQAHAYGRGWQHKGYPVDTVAIAFLPRNAELGDTVWWSEPYNERIAVDALARAEAISLANGALGPAAPAAMTTADSNCGYCPWFKAGATDLTRACPGDTASSVGRAADRLQELIA